MGNLATQLLLLAAGDTPASTPASGDGGAGGLWAMAVPFLLIAVFFYFMLIAPQKRERQKQEQFHKNLKKNDRVVTIGGVVGTIVNIEPEGKLVTLKVDDNTRMSFVRDAIQRKYAEASETPALKETPK
jgi:preprotein translocase subunit YajC